MKESIQKFYSGKNSVIKSVSKEVKVYDEEHHSNMEREALEKNIKQETDYFLSDHNEDIDY